MKGFMTGLLALILTCITISGIMTIIDKNKNHDVIQVETEFIGTPTYSQGFFDGMNATIKYLDETNQLKDSTKLELTWFIDEEQKMELLKTK